MCFPICKRKLAYVEKHVVTFCNNQGGWEVNYDNRDRSEEHLKKLCKETRELYTSSSVPAEDLGLSPGEQQADMGSQTTCATAVVPVEPVPDLSIWGQQQEQWEEKQKKVRSVHNIAMEGFSLQQVYQLSLKSCILRYHFVSTTHQVAANPDFFLAVLALKIAEKLVLPSPMCQKLWKCLSMWYIVAVF